MLDSVTAVTDPTAFISPTTLKVACKENWLPDCVEVGLAYHEVNWLFKGISRQVVCKLNPGLAANSNFACCMLRGVEYPLSETVKLVPVLLMVGGIVVTGRLAGIEISNGGKFVL